MPIMDENDDNPQLPTDTLLLLQEFNAGKEAHSKRFENLMAKAENDFESGDGKLSMDLFGEDWNASQFWYTDETARILAQQLLDGATEDSAIAIVSAPSVYIQLRNIFIAEPLRPRPKLFLLEHDKRFTVFGSDFVPYDFQHPLRLPPELKGKFDRIICDPPFLSEDCQSKTALTVRFLSRHWSAPTALGEGLRLVTCTGERMQPIIGT